MASDFPNLRPKGQVSNYIRDRCFLVTEYSISCDYLLADFNNYAKDKGSKQIMDQDRFRSCLAGIERSIKTKNKEGILVYVNIMINDPNAPNIEPPGWLEIIKMGHRPLECQHRDKILARRREKACLNGMEYSRLEECQHFIEAYLGVKFKEVILPDIKSPMSNRHLPLICYNEELKLTLEYYGKEHYIYDPVFYEDQEDFQYQQAKDSILLKLCNKHNIKLLIVDYKVDELELFIRQKLEELGIKSIPKIKLNIKRVVIN